MIANPQLFNYRLIIGSLLAVLVFLGVFSFNSYKSIKSHEEFLEKEKYLIENELSELLNSYDDLNINYTLISSKLKQAKLETKNALDSLRLLKSDISIISKFKNQLKALKSKNKILVNAIDSLNSANEKLQAEKHYALKTIQKNSNTISELKETNAVLNKTIDDASILKVSEVNAKAYKINSKKKRFTSRAKRANAIDVCITLIENPLTIKGEKDIYIQIVGPNNNVLSDKGEVFFGNTSLIYSKKEIVDFDNKNLKICTSITTDKDDEPLLKGYYFINVFHKNTRLGSTSIKLK